MPAGVLSTVGHSTREQTAFVGLLTAHGIQLLVDVRTIPRSRHNPQFNLDVLPPTLAAAGIGYEYLAELGGLRKARPDSTNLAWRNASFRGFADYMQTTAFEQGLERLMQLAREQRTAIMCAEVVPFRCHRSLIADALVARSWQVGEISSTNRTRPHQLSAWARVDAGRVSYPAAQSLA